MKTETRRIWIGLLFAVLLTLLEVTFASATSLVSATPSATQPINVANAGSIAQVQWAEIFGPPHDIALSPDGKTLAVATAFNILVYDLDNLEEPLFELGGQKTLSRVIFSPDGQILASAGSSFDGTIWLWDMPMGGVKRAVLEGHTEAIYGIDFSPSGELLASGSRDNSVRVWEVKTGKELFFSLEHNKWVYCVAFSTDGATLASGGADGKIRLWDVESSQAKAVLEDAHYIQVDCLAFSPDGKLLASAGQYDTAIRLWDTQTWQTMIILRGHVERGVFSLAFNDQGTLLASGGGDNSIRLWDVNPDSPSFGKELVALQRHSDWVDSLVFSPDGAVLISASDRDGTIRIWEPISTNTTAIMSPSPTTTTAPTLDSQTSSPPTFSSTITPTPTSTPIPTPPSSTFSFADITNLLGALIGASATIIAAYLGYRAVKKKE